MVAVVGQPETGLVFLEESTSASFPKPKHLACGLFQSSKAGWKERLKIDFSKDGQSNKDSFKVHVVIITDIQRLGL